MAKPEVAAIEARCAKIAADMGYELLSEEDVEKEIAKQEKEEESINGKQK